MYNHKMDKNQFSEVEKLIEIWDKQLYFAVTKGTITRRLKSTPETYFFTVDEEYIYHNYYCDFGPLNISCLYKYCIKVNRLLRAAKGTRHVVHYTSSKPERKANAAFLVGAYSIIYLRMHPRDVSKILQQVGPFKQFLDASQYPCPFTLRLFDCYQAVGKAIAYNLINFEDFNDIEYDMNDRLEFGDMNWLVPRKFLALIGPTDNGIFNGHPPNFYIQYFLRNDVKTVIRLNNKAYDASVFTSVGIIHYDLIFPDGSTPPKDILIRFLGIVENTSAAVAVHCKAGLGRTGSLVGAYLVKHYRLSAREAIAWLRVCRPGSVIGQQQMWLEKIETWLWRCGNQYRIEHFGESDKIPKHKYGIYSKSWPIERERMIAESRKAPKPKEPKPEEHKKAIRHHKFKKRASKTSNIPQIASHNKILDIAKILSSVHGVAHDNNLSSSITVKPLDMKDPILHALPKPQLSSRKLYTKANVCSKSVPIASTYLHDNNASKIFKYKSQTSNNSSMVSVKRHSVAIGPADKLKRDFKKELDHKSKSFREMRRVNYLIDSPVGHKIEQSTSTQGDNLNRIKAHRPVK